MVLQSTARVNSTLGLVLRKPNVLPLLSLDAPPAKTEYMDESGPLDALAERLGA
jgi:hypothetical protein